MTMKKIISAFLILILIASSAISSNAEEGYKDYTDIGPVEGELVLIEDIYADKDKFHREIFNIQGTISAIEFKKLIGGKKFTIFVVEDSKGNSLNIYARGIVEGIDQGSEIKIHGRYSKSKKFLFKKYKNVMKARKIQIDDI